MTIYMGLDLSLVSPGVSIYTTQNEEWILYGFSQRVREHALLKQKGKTSIHLLPSIPNLPGTTNEERYEHIRYHIIETIMSRYQEEMEVIIGIESYAFGAKNAGSSYKLQELGGILKHGIWKRYPQWRQVTIPPTKWKKQTVGNGRATKSEIVDYVRVHGPCVPILDLLGLSVSKSGMIPCPAQDLADAACICLSMMSQSKKRRRGCDPNTA
jgi:Holliday junction resolvasome RuvABC endonuclease subunit